jgi:hypothetical protein
LDEDELTQVPSQGEEGPAAAAAALLSQAIAKLTEAASAAAGLEQLRAELAAVRASLEGGRARLEGELSQARYALQDTARRLEDELAEERRQRRALGEQLTTLAASLEQLVGNLQGLSRLMAELLERLSQPTAPPRPEEQPFMPGGEGVSLILLSVPGFQGLMEIQTALTSLPQVAGASLERFQEGESRVLLHLRAPVTATELAGVLTRSTDYAAVVEEARPELFRLRIRLMTRGSPR